MTKIDVHLWEIWPSLTLAGFLPTLIILKPKLHERHNNAHYQIQLSSFLGNSCNLKYLCKQYWTTCRSHILSSPIYHEKPGLDAKDFYSPFYMLVQNMKKNIFVFCLFINVWRVANIKKIVKIKIGNYKTLYLHLFFGEKLFLLSSFMLQKSCDQLKAACMLGAYSVQLSLVSGETENCFWRELIVIFQPRGSSCIKGAPGFPFFQCLIPCFISWQIELSFHKSKQF